MGELGRVKKGWTSNFFQTPNGIYELPISACAKACYIYLCRCADQEGQSFPSYKKIGQAIGWGRTKVAEALSELEQCGLLWRQKQFKENGARDTNLYTVVHPDDVVIPNKGETPPFAKRTTHVRLADGVRSSRELGPSAKRTVKIHKEQYTRNNTHLTTHTKEKTEKKSGQEQQTERACEKVQSALKEKGIQVHTKTVRNWLNRAPAEDILYAAELALQDEIRNPAGFIESLTKRGIVRIEKRESQMDLKYAPFYDLFEKQTGKE